MFSKIDFEHQRGINNRCSLLRGLVVPFLHPVSKRLRQVAGIQGLKWPGESGCLGIPDLDLPRKLSPVTLQSPVPFFQKIPDNSGFPGSGKCSGPLRQCVPELTGIVLALDGLSGSMDVRGSQLIAILGFIPPFVSIWPPSSTANTECPRLWYPAGTLC